MINRVTLVGRITKNPELKKTQSGKSVTSFTVACNRMKKEDGADFINCVAWNQSAEYLCNYAKKGYLVDVDGRLQVRSYETQSGSKQYITEVVAEHLSILESKKNDDQQANVPSYEPLQNQYEDVQSDYPEINSDDLPW